LFFKKTTKGARKKKSRRALKKKKKESLRDGLWMARSHRLGRTDAQPCGFQWNWRNRLATQKACPEPVEGALANPTILLVPIYGLLRFASLFSVTVLAKEQLHPYIRPVRAGSPGPDGNPRVFIASIKLAASGAIGNHGFEKTLV